MMNKQFNEAVVSLIAERIKQSGKTVDEVASKCLVSKQTLERIIQGNTTAYTITLHRIIANLGITEDDINERIKNGRKQTDQ